jgi:hypothetical protein
MTSELVVSCFYDLRDAEGFDRAARLLVARLRLTGMEGVRNYRFLGGGFRGRRLVAIYDTAEAWADLHSRIAPWTESAALRGAARLERIDVIGKLSPAMRDWVDQLGLGRRLRLIGGVTPAPEEPVRKTGTGRGILPRLAGG